MVKPSLSLSLLFVLATHLTAGCNVVLDIEKGVVREAAEAGCVGEACAVCDEADCEAGESCVDGRCQPSMDADLFAEDAEADASFDAGPDGSVAAECELVCSATERCLPTEQGAVCECLPEYHRVDGSCIPCGEGGASCVPHATCKQTDGVTTCTCDSDYEDVHGDGSECVDKCSLKGCLKDVATCSIVAGAASCACIPDYVGDGQQSCVFDAECSRLGCDENANCELSGTTRQCKCKPGFTGTGTECTNPDECAPPVPCLNGGRCHDGLDAFSCDCGGTGFTGKLCDEDINECTSRSKCGVTHRCENTIGNSQCVACATGFESSANGLACVDVDECQLGTHNCGASGSCSSNTEGSYVCTCTAGYTQTTGADGRPTCTLNGACEANLDNCVEQTDNGVCTSTGGSAFTCACRTGFNGNGVKASAGGTGCSDADECTSRAVCGNARRCNNTLGSYECLNCPAGHESSANGLACIDINECTSRSVCGTTRRCENSLGSYQCITCATGSQSSGDGLSCVDIDECAAVPCQNGGTCSQGAPGAYSCACLPGWTVPNCTVRICTSTTCGAHQTCTNTASGPSCSCNSDANCPSGAVTTCSADTRKVCSTDANGCVYLSGQSTCDVRMSCGGANCVCDTDSRCPGGAGSSCADTSTLRTCIADANQCVYYNNTSSNCSFPLRCGGSGPSASCRAPSKQGFPTDGLGQSEAFDGYLVVDRVFLSSSTTFVGFGAIVRAATNTGTPNEVVFAVYADVSTPTGPKPGALVGHTGTRTLPPAAGTYEFQAAAEVALTGNRWYWIGAEYRVPRNVAGTQFPVGGQTISEAYRSYPWNAALPNPFDQGVTASFVNSSFNSNYYLMVMP